MARYYDNRQISGHRQNLVTSTQGHHNRPLPLSPPAILHTGKDDTLRRKRSTPRTYGLRSENLYEGNSYYCTEKPEDTTYSSQNEDQFVNVASLQIAEHNIGPLVRRSKIRCGDEFKHLTVEQLVTIVNTQVSASRDVNNSDLEYYIKFTLLQKLKGDGDLRSMVVLMKASNYSIKHLTAQTIQNTILEMPLFQISDEKSRQLFKTGVEILVDEFCLAKNNSNCAILVEALMLQFLACEFIWMLNSNNFEAFVSDCVQIIEKKHNMVYHTSITTLSSSLLESFLSSVESMSVGFGIQSPLRIADWDRAIREKLTQATIVEQFSEFSFIEQISCVLLLVNTTIRRKDFDKTLRLLNKCITSLLSKENKREVSSLMFFVDWVVTCVLKWYETGETSKMHYNKQEIEKELLEILETVKGEITFCGKESFLFHENNDIRMWFFTEFVIQDKETETNLVHYCFQHLERLLIRLNLEIEPSHESVSNLQTQPQWIETRCRLFGTFGKLKILLPSTKCLKQNSSDDYKLKGDPQTTRHYMNELDMLTKIEEGGGHKNVVELTVHQCIPFPLYYIVCDHDAENLQSYLLRRRKEKKPIALSVLLEIILQALKAIDFLHGRGIVHRHVMAAAFNIRVDKNDEMIQLCDFKLAKELWNDGEQPRRFLIDLQCDDIPTRWSAPESLTQGIYSRMSDSWMLFMTTVEVLEHGRWPLTDHTNSSTETVIENMLFNEGRVHETPCIPRQVYAMILDGTEYEAEKRMELPVFEERLTDFTSRLPSQTAKDVYQSATQTWKSDSTMPKLSTIQLDCNSIPERGVPQTAKKYRKTDRDPEEVYDTDREIRRAEKHIVCRVVTECDITWVDEPTIEYEGQNLVVEEKVFGKFVQDVLPKLCYLRNDNLSIKPWPPKPITTEHTCDDEFKLRNSIPESSSLLEMCIHQELGHTLGDYLETIFKLALMVDSFHEAGWLLNCLRAKNVRVTADKTVIIPRIGRMVYNSNAGVFHRDHIEHQIPPDMKRWLPVEAIEENVISIYSDVYSFGMLLSEVCAILAANGPRYEDEVYEDIGENPNDILKEKEVNSAPFGHVHSDQLTRHLKEGHIPKRHLSCPEWLYEVMKKCWEFQRLDRPTMKDIIQDLRPHVANSYSIEKPILQCRREDRHSAPLDRQPKLPVTRQPSTSFTNDVAYSYSTSHSASISQPTENHEDSYEDFDSTAQKRQHGNSTSSSGRIRPKKKTHRSVFDRFSN